MIIDGRKIAKQILEEIKRKVARLNKPPVLGAVLVGGEPALKKFVDLKAKAAEKAGIGFKYFNFPEDIETAELAERIKRICNSGEVSGLLVELPLPAHLIREEILNSIPPEMDVDVLSAAAQEKFYAGNFEILPPAVEALKVAMDEIGIKPENKKAVVFGRGLLIGKPVAYWLKSFGAEVSEIDEFTKNPKQYSVKADIIVSGVGKPGLITGEMLKDGTCVFDFGYGKSRRHGVGIPTEASGKTVGDIDFASVFPKCRYITPVPGGMGPIVVASVLKNLIELNP